MLLELRAENYAVIDHAVAGFGPGLNLLTGETGAGKSILIDALAMLLGDKASSDMVRHGAEKAVVACVFETTPGAEEILEANGIDPDASEIILRREIAASGKGRVFVNNQPATVAVLRTLAPELALVHAQSETLGSFDASQQRVLLDRFANASLDAAKAAHSAWRVVKDKLESMELDEQDRLRMADLWRFQSREIAQAGLQSGEDVALETEKRTLANAEKIYTAAMSAYDVLYDSASSAEAALRAGERHLEELAKYDARFDEAAKQVASARAVVSDTGMGLRDYAEHISASPDRLAEVEDRLALLDRLKRKYASHGAPVEDVISFGEDVAGKLDEIENRDAVIAGLRKELAAAAEIYRSAATALTAQRKTAAAKLEKLAAAEVNDLAMKARFGIEVTAGEDEFAWSEHGWDAVEFRIATNAGEPLKPLDEIASGGEMSRVLLALKVSVEEGASKTKRRTALPRTLVFDEIDIGIGGRAAEAVGRKLKTLSAAQQVICITHLPQIAAFADHHFLIEKKEQGGRTKTGVRLLDASERRDEVARMLSGAKLTEASLKNAEQMLKASR
jgi:DNA repair protein RecN (Recombination protein N)